MKYYFSLLLLLCSFYLASANSLHDSVRSGNLIKLKELLACATEDDLYEMEEEEDELGGVSPTPFELAVSLGNLECAKAFLALDDFDVDCTFGERTPLHQACEDGNLSIVELLLSSSANIHTTSALDGYTPLQYASEALVLNEEDTQATESDFVSIVELLIEKGANPKLKKVDDEWEAYETTPLSLAIDNNRAKIIKILSEHGATSTTSTSS